MNKKYKTKLTNFENLKDKYLGKVGTKERDSFEKKVQKEASKHSKK